MKNTDHKMIIGLVMWPTSFPIKSTASNAFTTDVISCWYWWWWWGICAGRPNDNHGNKVWRDEFAGVLGGRTDFIFRHNQIIFYR